MSEPRNNKRPRYDEDATSDDAGLISAAEGFFEALCKLWPLSPSPKYVANLNMKPRLE